MASVFRFSHASSGGMMSEQPIAKTQRPAFREIQKIPEELGDSSLWELGDLPRLAHSLQPLYGVLPLPAYRVRIQILLLCQAF